MALANGQAAQADEAQSISDLTDASNQAQTPQTASTAQLATSEPASVEPVQASQPANIMPAQPQVTTVQAAEQTPTIDRLVETSNPQTQEISANVLTNATEDQGQVKEYSTERLRCKMPYTTHEAEKMQVLKMALQFNSQRIWNLRLWKRLTKLMLNFLKRMRQLLSMSLNQPML